MSVVYCKQNDCEFLGNGKCKKDTIDIGAYGDCKDYLAFPWIVGELTEMFVNGQWVRGKIVEGYRFNDGIVTIEDENGKRYWCGQDRTDLYRKVIE